MKTNVVMMTALLGASAFGTVHAEQALDNVNVTQLGTYAGASDHFVWVNGGAVTPECQNMAQPVFVFNEALPGGKAMFATLTTALVNNRKVMVRASGCTITEVYLR